MDVTQLLSIILPTESLFLPPGICFLFFHLASVFKTNLDTNLLQWEKLHLIGVRAVPLKNNLDFLLDILSLKRYSSSKKFCCILCFCLIAVKSKKSSKTPPQLQVKLSLDAFELISSAPTSSAVELISLHDPEVEDNPICLLFYVFIEMKTFCPGNHHAFAFHFGCVIRSTGS